jgi:alkanesulfonate monooxygenase SsuD/methylene tetrahydromethanopterin reductase-like flavin-dependent oxidoreductase (luciferase family)
MSDISLGLDTFGDVTLGTDGQPKPMDQVLRDVVEEAVLADGLGIDFIGLGEHHRPDFAISAPEIVLAAIAGRTSRIRLGTAVTVLSTDDPVRVFQRFSTLNAVSNGRAEAILGAGPSPNPTGSSASTCRTTASSSRSGSTSSRGS